MSWWVRAVRAVVRKEETFSQIPRAMRTLARSELNRVFTVLFFPQYTFDTPRG